MNRHRQKVILAQINANEMFVARLMQARGCTHRSAVRHIREALIRSDQGQNPKFPKSRLRRGRNTITPVGARRKLIIVRSVK